MNRLHCRFYLPILYVKGDAMNSRTSCNLVGVPAASKMRGAASLCLVVVLHFALASAANAYCPACGKRKPETCGRGPRKRLCNECKCPDNFEDSQSDQDGGNEDEKGEHNKKKYSPDVTGGEMAAEQTIEGFSHVASAAGEHFFEHAGSTTGQAGSSGFSLGVKLLLAGEQFLKGLTAVGDSGGVMGAGGRGQTQQWFRQEHLAEHYEKWDQVRKKEGHQ